MRTLIITAVAGLAFGCLAAGCTAPAEQPPALLGGSAQSPREPSSSSATAVAPGSASNAHLSTSQISAAMTGAAGQATAVHLTGTFTAGGTSVTMDSILNRDGTSAGTLTYLGATIPFRVSGGTEYFQLTSTFMTLIKMTQASAEGKWVTGTSAAGQGLVTVFRQFLTLKDFVKTDMDFSGGTDIFTFEGLDHVGAQAVAVYREDHATEPVYTFDMAATGPVLPVKITGGDSDNGSNVELAWNQPTSVTAPPSSQIYAG